ncbi:MAG: hypothetical protein ACRENE_21895 [Polyangiaceae bacterium]
MTTLRTAAAVAAIACLSTLSTTARADDPATNLSNSPLIVSVERGLTFFAYSQASTSNNMNGVNATSSSSATSIGLVAGFPATSGVGPLFPLVPRIGVDTVVGPHITLGGGIWVLTDVSASTSTNASFMGMNVNTSQDAPKTTYWGIAPRVGYLLPLASNMALWPRAGIEYHSASDSTVTNTVNGSTSTSGGGGLNQFSMDLEANFVITPVDHFGFNILLYGAIPLSGTETTTSVTTVNNGTGMTTTMTTTNSVNVSETVVGLTAGVLGYF